MLREQTIQSLLCDQVQARYFLVGLHNVDLGFIVWVLYEIRVAARFRHTVVSIIEDDFRCGPQDLSSSFDPSSEPVWIPAFAFPAHIVVEQQKVLPCNHTPMTSQSREGQEARTEVCVCGREGGKSVSVCVCVCAFDIPFAMRFGVSGPLGDFNPVAMQEPDAHPGSFRPGSGRSSCGARRLSQYVATPVVVQPVRAVGSRVELAPRYPCDVRPHTQKPPDLSGSTCASSNTLGLPPGGRMPWSPCGASSHVMSSGYSAVSRLGEIRKKSSWGAFCT